ncbi:hypothetical protein [Histidinibacterium lentulum]|uniref:DUF3617 family protein n=1 Tax=Histidinibacterium lentulum TaxID=2480588 RepID=A0A3N2QWF1_9RHOB|nr:hypothetical protein [Histidinibacterium lentulum]ROT99480.1 hypothetical protein EAT49_14810 [Histidinibacterium lentulum]
MRLLTHLGAGALATIIAAPLTAQDDRPIPEAAWEAEFMGRYAVDGACNEDEATWLLNDFQVRFGSTWCTSMGKRTWEDGAMVVPLSDCREGAVSVPSRIMTFLQDGDDLIVQMAEYQQNDIEGTEAQVGNIDSEEIRLQDCGERY